MAFATRLTLTVSLFSAYAAAASAHYPMLLSERAAVKKGEAVTFTYQWGHPFEHQLFDAAAPERVAVVAPDGKQTDLTKTLEKIALKNGDKQVVAYRFRFTPEQRGDYVFSLQAAPVWMDEDEAYLHDTVKVVLHVQAQKGWDHSVGEGFELLPLTRPYGLQAGMVFQAQVQPKPAGAAYLVEVERYNPAPPKELPPDEQITRVVKTDPLGVATSTLTEPGWWCLAAGRDGGQKERDGKRYPVRQRALLWVFVDDKPK